MTVDTDPIRELIPGVRAEVPPTSMRVRKRTLGKEAIASNEAAIN